MSDPNDEVPESLDGGNPEGPTYTRGSSFRARAEALARRFRADELRVGWEKYGHLLDPRAAEAGANFLHPAVLGALKARTAQGKGIHTQRTLENMLSSQSLCFNLFAPLASEQHGLELARDLLAPHVPGLAHVRSIEIEYTPPFEVFHDQSGHAGVDCDVLIEFETDHGGTGVLVIETKFVEEAFSPCGHCRKGRCPPDVRIGRDFSGCRYVNQNHYRYWDRGAETGSLKLSFVDQSGCPFAGPLWQIWVNHTLACTEAKRRGATRGVFAVCAPDANDALNARALLEDYKAHVTDPTTVVFIALEPLLERLEQASATHPTLAEWAAALRRRYTVPVSQLAHAAKQLVASARQPLTDGHRRMTAWMATDEFRDLVARHDAALEDRATIYFRPTDKGLVRIALHPSAPGYVGFRRAHNDNGHLVRPGQRALTVEEIRAHFKDFEIWLPSVRRSSDEERGVVPWLRLALKGKLWLPDLGEGWAFLHQEWRFADASGQGKKSDVLAVHLPTGQLGIVEFKSGESERASAQAQVEAYAAFWERDAEELAPWFTDLVRALGRAYGNDEAAVATVTSKPAALFVGTASPGAPTRIQRHAPLATARRA